MLINLPNELLLQIIGYLSSTVDIARLRRCASRFDRLIFTNTNGQLPITSVQLIFDVTNCCIILRESNNYHRNIFFYNLSTNNRNKYKQISFENVDQLLIDDYFVRRRHLYIDHLSIGFITCKQRNAQRRPPPIDRQVFNKIDSFINRYHYRLFDSITHLHFIACPPESIVPFANKFYQLTHLNITIIVPDRHINHIQLDQLDRLTALNKLRIDEFGADLSDTRNDWCLQQNNNTTVQLRTIVDDHLFERITANHKQSLHMDIFIKRTANIHMKTICKFLHKWQNTDPVDSAKCIKLIFSPQNYTNIDFENELYRNNVDYYVANRGNINSYQIQYRFVNVYDMRLELELSVCKLVDYVIYIVL